MLPIKTRKEATKSLNRDYIHNKKQSETQQSIQKFVKCEIYICQSLTLELVVDKTWTLSQLAKFIEAECFHKHSRQISCCFLTNSNWEPLHFDSLVRKVTEEKTLLRIFDYTDGKFFRFVFNF